MSYKYRGKDGNFIFQGTELFKVGLLGQADPFPDPQATVFRARIKINTIPPGSVYGFFPVESNAGFPNSPGVDPDKRDEIDFEFLGNLLSKPPVNTTLANHLWLNVYNNGQQLPASAIPVNPDLEEEYWKQWHTYTIRWSKDSITWQVNDLAEPPKTDDPNVAEETVLKRVTTNIPNGPLQLHLNTWVPTGDPNEKENFPQAANSNLQPAPSKEANQTSFYEVKWVQIGYGIKARGKAKVSIPAVP